MKRIVLLLLTASMLLGCLPTPEQDIVVNKTEGGLDAAISATSPAPVYETEQIDLAAPLQSSEPAGTLRSALNAPSHCTDSAEGKVFGGTLKVSIDADVEVPNVASVPVFTVRDKVFSATETEQAVKLLLGDGPYYNYNRERMYRDSDKAKIDENAEILAALDARAYGENFPYDSYRKRCEESLKSHSESLASLPEPGPMEPWTGSFSDAYLQLADASNRRFMMDEGELYLYDAIGSVAFANTVRRMPENETERQAADAASAVFAALSGTPFRVTGIEGDYELFNAQYGSKRPIRQYNVRLAPLYAGIPAYPYTAYHGSDTGRQAAGVSSSDDYGEPIRPTVAEALVKDGEVIALNWYNVFTITGTENENVALLPFEKVLDVFKRQVYYSIYFDPPEPDETGDPVMQMVVERICFSYMRVKKADGSGESYLLPVWDFMGYDYNPEDPHTEHDLVGTKAWFAHQSLLTVNAVDGSILDRDKGY